MVGKDSPETVVTTLLKLVVIHSTVPCVVIGLELKTILLLAVVLVLIQLQYIPCWVNLLLE